MFRFYSRRSGQNAGKILLARPPTATGIVMLSAPPLTSQYSIFPTICPDNRCAAAAFVLNLR